LLSDLLAEIERQGPDPIVSLESFFEGNDDPASIGCNLEDHPGVPRFYAVLRAIRERPDVHGVWVGITEVMGPDEWPFSDTVYVVTSAPSAEVAEWTAELQPDEPGPEEWTREPPARLKPVPAGSRVVTVWWD
jgi:hypothetical protein